MSTKAKLPVNGADLCVETFGKPTDPTGLLIMGAAASMDFWPDGFCEQLAAQSLHVLRYDNRDTGESTSYPPGKPTYTSADLVADAVGILDALGVSRAHVIGVSMGGGIAQQLASSHPARVKTLTVMSSSPDSGQGLEDVELSPMSDELKAAFNEPAPEPDWTDRAAVVDYFVEANRLFQGSVTFAEADLRDLVGRVFDRSRDFAASMTNHWILEGGDLPEPNLADVLAPTLVLHGTEDPLFPFDHAEAFSRVMPSVRLVALEGVGHGELPPAIWSTVVAAIAKHAEG